MNPSVLIPTADAIPVPWGWFYVLLMLTFLLHLLVMNVMLGGGIIAFFTTLSKRQETRLIGREISYKWPYAIAFAVNMGVAPLLFVQVLYGQFIYSSSVLMACWWLSIVGVLILAYYSAYIFDFKYDSLQSMKLVTVGFSVVSMLFIAFLFSNNMTLMLEPEKWSAYFDNRGGTLLNLSNPVLWPRYLHFVIGSIAVAGLFYALVGYLGFTKSEVDKEMLTGKGMKFFTHATMLQLVIGIWYLFVLPDDIMRLFMGGSLFGTVLLTSGFLTALVVLYFGFRKKILVSAGGCLLLLIIMILLRDLVRRAYLDPYFSVTDLVVVPEYSPMIFFLAVFALGLGLIGYMLKLVFTSAAESVDENEAGEGAK